MAAVGVKGLETFLFKNHKWQSTKWTDYFLCPTPGKVPGGSDFFHQKSISDYARQSYQV